MHFKFVRKCRTFYRFHKDYHARIAMALPGVFKGWSRLGLNMACGSWRRGDEQGGVVAGHRACDANLEQFQLSTSAEMGALYKLA